VVDVAGMWTTHACVREVDKILGSSVFDTNILEDLDEIVRYHSVSAPSHCVRLIA
jgi:hypothetical protein